MSRIRRQLPLMQAFISHEHGQELAAMDKILDSIRLVLAPIGHDLTKGCSARRGRAGMTADQVLRALIVKQLNGFSYARLSFHLADSTCYRSFCRLGAFEATPSRSTLQENIKKLSPQTLQKVHEAIVHQAIAEGMEDGKRLRVDCTVTETNIHEPTDSSLLWDVVRVLVGQLRRSRVYGARFSNHARRAKRRWLGIQNAKRMKHRVPLYRDLMRITESTCDDAVRVAGELEAVDEPRAAACEVIVDRTVAIEAALAAATSGDIVIVAGKGHEDYQLVGDQILDLDDRRIIREWIARKGATETDLT